MRDGKRCILIADDDREIREVLSLLLSGEGYTVLAVEDGRAVLEQARPDIDLFILDVNMPERNGISTAIEIRKQYYTPIIFLTACSGEADKIMGFSAGADDYIVKPFSNLELLMRIRAILRRKESFLAATELQSARNQLVFGDVVLDRDSQTVVKGGQTIALTYTEFKILELLASHKKKVFSLENIYQSIWNDDAVGDGTIMAHIKNIRKKLGDNSRDPVYIKTAWGRGYYID